MVTMPAIVRPALVTRCPPDAGRAHLTTGAAPHATGPLRRHPAACVRLGTWPFRSRPSLRLRRARFAELTPFELYGLCRLRSRRLRRRAGLPLSRARRPGHRADTEHLWFESTTGRRHLRMLDDGGSPASAAWPRRPAPAGRGSPPGSSRRASARRPAPRSPRAQAHLEGWYEPFGFGRSGPGYVEDGIPHVPMRREPALSALTGGRMPADLGDRALLRSAADRLEALAARTTAGDWRIGGLLASRPEVIAAPLELPTAAPSTSPRHASRHRLVDHGPLPRGRRPPGDELALGWRPGRPRWTPAAVAARQGPGRRAVRPDIRSLTVRSLTWPRAAVDEALRAL